MHMHSFSYVLLTPKPDAPPPEAIPPVKDPDVMGVEVDRVFRCINRRDYHAQYNH